MTDDTPKLFVAYDTTVGQIWFDEIRTRHGAEIATEVQNDLDSKPHNWRVAKIKYIEPVEESVQKIEIIGTKHFDLANHISEISNFMAGVKADSKQERETRCGIFIMPKCLTTKFEEYTSPYHIMEYLNGNHSGKFSVQNSVMNDSSSRIERDNSGKILYFDTVEEADKYIEKEMNFKISVGDVSEKRFVIYNKETKEIATFSCSEKITTVEWGKDALKQLKTLVDDGLSASEIATILGVSKNSIVGKINRLGWKLNKTKEPVEKNDTNKEYIKPAIVSKEFDICHGIFSSNNAAKCAAEQLNLWTHEQGIWRVARLTQVELVDKK